MPRATRNAKRSHITVFKPRGKKQKTGSRTMMVVLVPKKTEGEKPFMSKKMLPPIMPSLMREANHQKGSFLKQHPI
jgi:hypothetical protein